MEAAVAKGSKTRSKTEDKAGHSAKADDKPEDKSEDKPSKIILVTGKDPTPDEGEAILEQEWKRSGDLSCPVFRLGLGLVHGEISPKLAWAVNALIGVANASVDIKPYRRLALKQVRYIAVCEAHYRDGCAWGVEGAGARAAEMLRGWPAEGTAAYMWAEYKAYRKILREAGVVRDGDDNPGYRWIDTLGKS
jgi:hypothetical protein